MKNFLLLLSFCMLFTSIVHTMFRSNKNFLGILQPRILDIFKLGERKMCNDVVPAGMTREQWYRQMMQKQDDKLRQQLQNMLQISDDVKHEIQVSIKNSFENFAEGCEQFLKRDIEIERLLASYNKYYKVFILEKDYQCSALATAGAHIIYVRQGFYDLDNISRSFTLCHECSHIKHQDMLYHILYSLVATLRKNKQKILNNKVLSKIYPCCDNNESFQINLDRIETRKFNTKEYMTVFAAWKMFTEYRADMESFFSIKEVVCEEFKDKLGTREMYQGFPCQVTIEFAAGYQNMANVDYINDFLDGISKDWQKNS